MVSRGYARVSKSDGSQTLDSQIDALVAAGVDRAKIHTDTASGKKVDRDGLAECMKALNEGDTLYVYRLDRLGRSLPHLIETVNKLHEGKIGLKVLNGLDYEATADGRLLFSIFGALAQFERELLVERTRAGLTAARARGRIGGRRPGLTKAGVRRAQSAMQHRDTDIAELCAELGVSRTALYRYIGPNGELRDQARKVLGIAEAG